MNVSYKRDMTHNYMVPELTEQVQEEDYRVHMLMENHIGGLLPCSIRRVNCQSRFFYDITSRQAMEHVYGNSRMGAEDIRILLRGLHRTLREVKKYLLDIDRIVLEPQMIYMDIETREPFFCYLPGYQKDIVQSFRELTAYLLERLEQSDSEAVLLGYEVYRKAREENYSLEKLLQEAARPGEKRYGGEPADMKEQQAERRPAKTYINPYRDRKDPYDEDFSEAGQRRRDYPKADHSRSDYQKTKYDPQRIPGAGQDHRDYPEADYSRRDYPKGGYDRRDYPERGYESANYPETEYARSDSSETEHAHRKKAAGGKAPRSGKASPGNAFKKQNAEKEKQKEEKERQKQQKKRRDAQRKEKTKTEKKTSSGKVFLLSCFALAVALLLAAAWFWKLNVTQTGGILFLLAAILAYGLSSEGKKDDPKEDKELEKAMEDFEEEPYYEETGFLEERQPVRGKQPYREKPQYPGMMQYYREQPVHVGERVNYHADPSGDYEQRTHSWRMGDTGVLYENADETSRMILTSHNPYQRDGIILEEDSYIIGKLPSQADIVLEHPSVSRVHAKIERRGGEYYLCDLNSTNGTFLNGRRLMVNERVKIHPGDEIAFAKMSYQAEQC